MITFEQAFGYGSTIDIKKISLKNIEELKAYLIEMLETNIDGEVNDLEIKFLDNSKLKIEIEEVVD